MGEHLDQGHQVPGRKNGSRILLPKQAEQSGRLGKLKADRSASTQKM